MAKTCLSNAPYVQYGYGQVEPNHLSAQRTGQIYAQLPAAKAVTMLENGQFVKYDYANNVVNFTGDGEWMLVFNEVKVYEDRQTDCDFAMKQEDYDYAVYNAAGTDRDTTTQNTMVPRVFKTNLGDIFTTNTIKTASASATLAVGDKLQVGADGYLAPATGETLTGMVWKVVKVYTTPDMQRGVKILRIQ